VFFWVVVGYSLCFGKSIGVSWRSYNAFLFKDVNSGEPWVGAPTIPKTLFSLFQLMFAIVTPALVVGAVAERIRFTSFILFIVLFSVLVYAPLAHWSWHPDGFLAKMGALDFAGGTVVHISAGCAALAGALVLKRRKVHIEKKEIPPANIPYVLIGTGLLWFGWFGFNAGSAGAANSLAVSAFGTTNTAAAAAGLSWMLFDVLRGRKPSVMGFCIGAVVGLVAITPAAGFVAIPQSIFIGVVAAVISNVAFIINQSGRYPRCVPLPVLVVWWHVDDRYLRNQGVNAASNSDEHMKLLLFHPGQGNGNCRRLQLCSVFRNIQIHQLHPSVES
jgi:Amt family ammonium transporter